MLGYGLAFAAFGELGGPPSAEYLASAEVTWLREQPDRFSALFMMFSMALEVAQLSAFAISGAIDAK